MIKKSLIALVRGYQKFISPLTPPSCRYEPTCSSYMIVAIEKHGIKGVLMGIARILRCNPLSRVAKTLSQIISPYTVIKIFVITKKRLQA